jgi:nucleoid-associated protein YgaU
MTGTSKAVLSICVLLLAALVLYYGMVPVDTQPSVVGDIPSRTTTDVHLFGRDLDAAAAALGIPAAIVKIAEEPATIENIPVPEKVVESEPVVVPISTKPVLATKEEVLYNVVSGDTLGGIAQKLLGSSRHASKIASLNGIVDPRTIQLGRTLRIPSIDTPVAVAVAVSESSPIPSNVTTHVILSGETLSDIAEDYLGSPHQWLVLWNANKSRISNPDRLKVGVSIVIP